VGDDTQMMEGTAPTFKVLELLVGDVGTGTSVLVVHVESHACALLLHDHLVKAANRSLWWTENEVRLMALRDDEQVVVSAPLGDPADGQRLSEVKQVILWWGDQTLAPVSVMVGGLMREI
jgi:hypothetical protein